MSGVKQLSDDLREQAWILKRLEEIQARLARVEDAVGPYRPKKAAEGVAGSDRAFLPTLKRLINDIDASSTRLERATKIDA